MGLARATISGCSSSGGVADERERRASRGDVQVCMYRRKRRFSSAIRCDRFERWSTVRWKSCRRSWKQSTRARGGRRSRRDNFCGGCLRRGCGLGDAVEAVSRIVEAGAAPPRYGQGGSATAAVPLLAEIRPRRRPWTSRTSWYHGDFFQPPEGGCVVRCETTDQAARDGHRASFSTRRIGLTYGISLVIRENGLPCPLCSPPPSARKILRGL